MLLSEEDVRRRRSRNRAVAWALVAFVVLIFVGSIAKMSSGELPVLNGEVGFER